VQLLCNLPAARRVARSVVTELWRKAAELRSYDCITTLGGLPAAQQVFANVVQRHMMLMVTIGTSEDSSGRNCITSLCALPGAKRLTSSAVQQLLDAAVTGGMRYAAAALCALPAARQLDCQAVQQLLQVGLQGDSLGTTAALLSLPGARTVGDAGDEIETHLVAAATKQGSREGLQMLASCLQEAPQMDGAVEVQVRAAVQKLWVGEALVLLRKGDAAAAKGVGALCAAPIAEFISSNSTFQVLSSVVEQGKSACTRLLCSVPAAQQLSSSDMQQLLLTAVQLNRKGCCKLLCDLPAAMQLDRQAVQRLLRVATERRSSGCKGALSKLLLKH
jgi:hypothetical protein